MNNGDILYFICVLTIVYTNLSKLNESYIANLSISLQLNLASRLMLCKLNIRLYTVTLLINLNAEYIMRNAGLDETQAGIKIAGRNISNLRYADDITLMAESEEELNSLLMKVKKESEKPGLKLNIPKTKIMASGPITSWQIDGETVETVTDFILGAPKSLQLVTAAMKLKDTCSLEEKLCQSKQYIKKQRHYFADKVLYNQIYGFSSSHIWI